MAYWGAPEHWQSSTATSGYSAVIFEVDSVDRAEGAQGKDCGAFSIECGTAGPTVDYSGFGKPCPLCFFSLTIDWCKRHKQLLSSREVM